MREENTEKRIPGSLSLLGKNATLKSVAKNAKDTHGLVQEDHPSLRREEVNAKMIAESLKPGRITKSTFIANVVSLAGIRTMFYAVLFLPDIFVFDMQNMSNFAYFQDLTLVFNLLTIGLCLLIGKISYKRLLYIGDGLLIATPLWVCLYVVALTIPAPGVLLLGMRFMSHVLYGGCLGVVFVNWICAYALRTENDPLYVGASLPVAALAILVMRAMPAPAASLVITILPLFLVPAMHHLGVMSKSLIEEREAQPHLEGPIEADKRLWLTLGIVGFVSGATFGYMATSQMAFLTCSIGCMLIALVLGIALVFYFLRTGKNPGFSVSLAAILSLVCIGQGLLSCFGRDYLPLTYGIVFLGSTLFECVLLLQLPFVFRKKRSLRTFFAMWELFYGFQIAGILFRGFLLAGFEPVLFRWVAALTMILSIGVMAIVLKDHSTSTAWGFLPIPVRSNQRYRTACENVRAEYGLTPRELDIMSMVGRGRNGTYIQEKLVISKSTYQTHMRNLYKKLDIHTDQELIDIIEDELEKNKALDEATRQS